MATRNTAGRRLLSEAELEFANPFDQTDYNNIVETANAPVVTENTKQNLVNQLLANWQGLGTEVGIGSSGTESAEIGGRNLSVVANDFAQRLIDQGITDLSQAKFEPGQQAAWTAEGKGNVSLMATEGGRLIPVWGSSSDASKARSIALTIGSMLVAPGLAGALGGGLGGFAGAGAILGGTKAAITGGDILKGAATGGLGGAVGYGLFGGSTPTSDAQFIAADAAQLASQGLGAEQIQQVLQSSGVNVGTAISAADVAASGMPADQIADYIVGNKGLFSEAASQAPATPTTVTTSPEGIQTVTTTQAPVQTPAVSFPVIPSALAPSVPLAEVPPTPIDQTVEVTAKKEEPAIAPTTGVSIDLPSALSGGGLETADQAARTENQGSGLTLKDLYTALQAIGALSSTGLFGGGGGGGGGQQRAFVPPTATVPTGNEDYYNAVQQYYNTYMPTAPRDVSTPLQQWYQGKFGG